MIFSEIYGEYFNAVAKILDTAVRGELNENDEKVIKHLPLCAFVQRGRFA